MSKKYKKLKRMILSTIAMSSAFTIFGCTSEKTQEVVNMDKNNTYVENTISEKLAESGTVESSTEVSTNVLEEVDSNVNYDRGESKGEIVVNNFDSDKTEEVNTVGQGGDKSLLDKVESTEDGGNNFYSITEDGKYEVKPDLVALINETTFGAGATVTEIEKFINDNSDLVFFIENDDIEGFMQILESIYTTTGKLSPEQQVTTTTPSTPSTSTEVANNNQTTSGNTSSSGGSDSSTGSADSTGGSTGSSTGSTSSSSGSLQADWIPDDQLPPRSTDGDDGSNDGWVDVTRENSGTGPLTSNIGIE